MGKWTASTCFRNLFVCSITYKYPEINLISYSKANKRVQLPIENGSDIYVRKGLGDYKMYSLILNLT